MFQIQTTIVSLYITISLIGSCYFLLPSDGDPFVDRLGLLQYENTLLISIEAWNAWRPPYCKILNVSDGTLSKAINHTECIGYVNRSWTNHDSDPSSTDIVYTMINSSSTGILYVSFVLQRNNDIFEIYNIPLQQHFYNPIFKNFTFNSINTTFILVANVDSEIEVIVIQFASQIDNSIKYVSNIGYAKGDGWWQWDFIHPQNISVYEDLMAINLKAMPGLCNGDFVGLLQFNYTKDGHINELIMTTSLQFYNVKSVDRLSQKIYSIPSIYGNIISLFVLDTQSDTISEFDLNLTYNPKELIMSTSEPTNHPSCHPSLSFTTDPNKSPTQSPLTSNTKDFHFTSSHTTTSDIKELNEENSVTNIVIYVNDNSYVHLWTAVGAGLGLVCIFIIILGVIVVCVFNKHFKRNDDNISGLKEMIDDKKSDLKEANSIEKPTNNNPQIILQESKEGIQMTEQRSNQDTHESRIILQSWLESIQLTQYCDVFVTNGYDSLCIIKEITDSLQLTEIGITNQQHQIQIMNAIEKLKNSYIKTHEKEISMNFEKEGN
eukprot:131955_1